MPNVEAKRLRVFDVARAFHLIALQPEKALPIIDAFPDTILEQIESHFRASVSKSTNGEPFAVAISTLMIHPFVSVVQTEDLLNLPGIDSEKPFHWTKVGERGAKDVRFDCEWNGLGLRIVKRGPADYEGFIGDERIARAKFKKNLRERMEREAAKKFQVAAE